MPGDDVLKFNGNHQGLDDSRLMFAFAHDLRAHLRTVLTRIQLVQRGGGDRLHGHELAMLQEAATAAGEIGGLLNAMMAYLDVQASEGTRDLRILLQGTLLERKAALQAAGAEVEVANDLQVSVPAGLQSVLKELITNACKFREPKRPLRIRIAAQSTSVDGLEIAVTDNGLGVPAEYVEKIFSPFQRLHSRDDFPGHALGLATCRRLAATWGGTVSAQHIPDGGLTIRVTC